MTSPPHIAASNRKSWHHPTIEMLLQRTDKLESILRVVAEELRERIDGATETRGRDTWITALIDICENALANKD